MRKLLLLISVAILAAPLSANIENAAKVFRRHTISQKQLKASLLLCRIEVAGKDGGWDSFGGAPDVSMQIQASGDVYSAKAQDTHRPLLSFPDIDIDPGENITLTLADADALSNDDPIGQHNMRFSKTPFKIKARNFSLECRSVSPKLVNNKRTQHKRQALLEAQTSTAPSGKELRYACPLTNTAALRQLGHWVGKSDEAYLEVAAARAASCQTHLQKTNAQHQRLLAKATKVQSEKSFGASSMQVSELRRKDKIGTQCTFTVSLKKTLGPVQLQLYNAQGKLQHIRQVSPLKPPLYDVPSDEKIEFDTQCKGASDALLYWLDVEGRTLKSRAFRITSL